MYTFSPAAIRRSSLPILEYMKKFLWFIFTYIADLNLKSLNIPTK